MRDRAQLTTPVLVENLTPERFRDDDAIVRGKHFRGGDDRSRLHRACATGLSIPAREFREHRHITVKPVRREIEQPLLVVRKALAVEVERGIPAPMADEVDQARLKATLRIQCDAPEPCLAIADSHPGPAIAAPRSGELPGHGRTRLQDCDRLSGRAACGLSHAQEPSFNASRLFTFSGRPARRRVYAGDSRRAFGNSACNRDS